MPPAGVVELVAPGETTARASARLVPDRPSLPTAPVFTRTDGRPPRAHHVDWAWRTARNKVGLSDFHFHDCRHASLTLAAQLGATTAEVMRRPGHSSTRAALIYQHAAESRDVEIAVLMSNVAPRESTQSPRKDRSAGH